MKFKIKMKCKSKNVVIIAIKHLQMNQILVLINP